MALSITDLAIWLQEETAWQATPEPISHLDYKHMIVRGLKRLFIDTGRASEYDQSLLDAGAEGWTYNRNFLIDEEEYIILCAQIVFFKRVQSDVNNILGYSTDALTVTNSDKPYANLRNTIDELEKRRRELYYRMPRYTLEYEVSDTVSEG